MRRAFALVVPLASLALLGCSSGSSGGGGGGASCPSLDNDCPASVPSWSKQVEEIATLTCFVSACHGPQGKAGPKFVMTNYAGLVGLRTTAITQVNSCAMPNADAGVPEPTLDPSDRQALLSWLVCGAPDN